MLLADDEPLIARLYARAVTAAGYQPVIAGGGEAAFAHIVEDPPALLVTDLNMPDLNGDALAKRILQRGLKTFAILLMSADDTAELVRAGVGAGVDDFFVKGMPFDLFQARLRHWVGGCFAGLPAHVRRDAEMSLDQRGAEPQPIARLHGDLGWIAARAALVITDLLAAEGRRFGERPVERLRALGVLDGIIAILARSDGLLQLRRLEVLEAALAALPAPWPARLRPLTARFEQAARDATFRHAAQTLRLSL